MIAAASMTLEVGGFYLYRRNTVAHREDEEKKGAV